MLYREIIAEIHTKHINTAVWAERGICVTPGGAYSNHCAVHIVTTGLWRVKTGSRFEFFCVMFPRAPGIDIGLVSELLQSQPTAAEHLMAVNVIISTEYFCWCGPNSSNSRNFLPWSLQHANSLSVLWNRPWPVRLTADGDLLAKDGQKDSRGVKR